MHVSKNDTTLPSNPHRENGNWRQRGRLTYVFAVKGNKDAEDAAKTQSNETGNNGQLQSYAAFGPDVWKHQLHFGQNIGPGGSSVRTAVVVVSLVKQNQAQTNFKLLKSKAFVVQIKYPHPL